MSADADSPAAGAPAPEAASGVLPEGTLVASRYRIESVIGQGAQSVVYLARRVDDRVPVALKVIHRHLTGNPKLARRFHREVEILKTLEGEHVVRLLDFVDDDEGLLALVMEYVEGTSLEALIQEKTLIPLDVAIEVILQVCAALGSAHANGIVHRDLKPANVLLAGPAGAAPLSSRAQRPPSSIPASVREVRVKVVDFGFAKVLQSGPASPNLTEQGMIFGTPEYMAPEQARGETVDARADLYAAGVILYEMAVGEVPFKGHNALGTMTAHLVQPVPSPRAGRAGSRVTPTLEAVIVRALAKTPADRYASARELAEAIASARDETRVIAPAPVGDPDEIAQSDTDLHLELGHANTMRPDEIASARSGRSEGAVSVASRTTAVPSTKPSPVRADERPRRADKPVVLRPEILDEPTAVSGVDPRAGAWSRVGWIIVAVVAAVVGVAIGVFVGTR
jgi:serine/threonine-protein kinase